MYIRVRRKLRQGSSCIVCTRCVSLAQLAIFTNRETILELHGLPYENSQRSKVLQYPKLRRIVTKSRALVDDLMTGFHNILRRATRITASGARSDMGLYWL